ncbi:PREDICTED: uncharacterized protein LOC108759501 [Trachymyrmex cornetzi]|uniref:uncharacterized protein LOC108759501 n=1 Tax=Trachymyrmex cornetzi TaxID=471704 RepID=UPI00084F095A|nr:PREDICTED: uncharacterized protein LOC108759501 [Trachymyrmex cornetzi]
MKYLGLVLDGRLHFEAHFLALAPKAESMAAHLCRLMPNLCGPKEQVRRLYMSVVNSIVLYGAPMWAGDAADSRRIRTILRGVQRRTVGRVVRAYKTASHTTVTALTGTPLLEMVALMYAEEHAEVSALKEVHGVESVPPQAVQLVRNRTRGRMMTRWRSWLNERELGGDPLVKAIAPHLDRWAAARVGLSFRATQVLTGHWCFGRYLCRIVKEVTPRCWHCGAVCDTARHTLRYCPAWSDDRKRLTEAMGQDLTTPNIVRGLLFSRIKRKAFFIFCENVMRRKKEQERAREGVPVRVENVPGNTVVGRATIGPRR